MRKSIATAALASFLLVSPALAVGFDDAIDYDQPLVPDLSQIKSPELQRVILWACVLSVQPVVCDCKWISWAFGWVEAHMPG